jgi:hypothetical protein
MELLATAVLVGIITYGLVEYTINHDGPWETLKTFRRWVGVNQPLNKPKDGGYVTEYVSNGTFLGDLFYCPYCLTPYVTAIIVILGMVSGLIIPDLTVAGVYFGALGTAVYLAKRSNQ